MAWIYCRILLQWTWVVCFFIVYSYKEMKKFAKKIKVLGSENEILPYFLANVNVIIWPQDDKLLKCFPNWSVCTLSPFQRPTFFAKPSFMSHVTIMQLIDHQSLLTTNNKINSKTFYLSGEFGCSIKCED